MAGEPIRYAARGRGEDRCCEIRFAIVIRSGAQIGMGTDPITSNDWLPSFDLLWWHWLRCSLRLRLGRLLLAAILQTARHLAAPLERVGRFAVTIQFAQAHT